MVVSAEALITDEPLMDSPDFVSWCTARMAAPKFCLSVSTIPTTWPISCCRFSFAPTVHLCNVSKTIRPGFMAATRSKKSNCSCVGTFPTGANKGTALV